MKSIAIFLLLFVALMATSAWADPKHDLGAPDGATPAGSPVVNSCLIPAERPATVYKNPSFPAREIVREKVVVRQVSVPHPKTIKGHHTGVGHSPVYKKIKKWNPASVSHVDAKVGKLGKEVRAELKSESAQRILADESLSKRIKPLEEKGGNNSLLILACMGLVAVAVVFLIGYTNQN